MAEKQQWDVEEYFKASQRDAKRAIEKVLDGFDFKKALAALRGCRWRFEGATRSPNEEELRAKAKSMLMDAMQAGSVCTIGWGPLMVRTWHYGAKEVQTVELTLVPVWKSAVFVDARMILARKKWVQKAAVAAKAKVTARTKSKP